MRWWTNVPALILIARAFAGPVEFGQAELARAIAARGLNPAYLRFQVEVDSAAPETYRISPGRITGGDLRGLMYGLLDAAEQVRLTGAVRPSQGAPATPIRGVRAFLHQADFTGEAAERERWVEFLRLLARQRFNRFNLVFDGATVPYPYWVAVEDYHEVRVPGLGDNRRVRNFEMLRMISDTAAEYGIDFTLGVWGHQAAHGLTPRTAGPYSYAALQRVLAGCPHIRSVQVYADEEVEIHRDYVFKAVHEAGRRAFLDLRSEKLPAELLDAAVAARMALRVSAGYGGKRPAGAYPFFWELPARASDAAYVRRVAPTLTRPESMGFEIDAPSGLQDFERHKLFYALWGRLSYDPKTPDRAWLEDLKPRSGLAAP